MRIKLLTPTDPRPRYRGREKDILAEIPKGAYRGRVRGFPDTLMIVGTDQQSGSAVLYLPEGNGEGVFTSFVSDEIVDVVQVSVSLAEIEK